LGYPNYIAQTNIVKPKHPKAMLLISDFYHRHLRRLLLIVFLFVSLSGMSQTFTFSFQRVALSTVISQIERESDYQFLYTEELLAQSVPITFTVRNVSLDSVLNLCFKTQPLDYVKEGKHIIIRKRIIEKPTQSFRELKGRIVNEQGEPMTGITVAIKQTTLITATDENGMFFFAKAPPIAILIITGVEIVTEEYDASHQTVVFIHVSRKVAILDETMVIAYGKTTRRFSTGSTSKVTHEEISKQPVSNPILALSGRVSGVQVSQVSGAPGSQVIVQLRGRNSLANGSAPLFIVDGVPFPSTTLNNSLAGASVYSSPLDNINPSDIERIDILKDADATAIYGSRGANGVILITTKKADAEQTKFSFRAYSGAGSITRKMDLLSTSQYLAMRREAFANDGTPLTNTNAPDLLLWDTTRYTDWQETLIGKTVSQQDLNLGVSGGNSFTQFLLSAGYHKETTVFPGDFSAKKINASFSLNHQSKNRRFSLSLSGSYLTNSNTLPREDISRRITLAPNAPSIYLSTGGLNWENSTWVNPFSILERSFTNRSQVLNSSLTLSYEILKGLTAKVSNGFTKQYLREHGITPQRSFNPSTVSASSANFGRTDLQTLISEPQISYVVQWKKHLIDAVAGITIQQTDQQNLLQTGTGYSSDALLHSIQAASTVTTSVDADIKYRYTGLFARAAYHFDRKYLVTITGRRDGSSRYGTANRFANFYSAGVGWVFSKESFMQHQHLISFGKLRGSIGRSGNDQIGDYRYLDLYSPYLNAYQSVTPFYPTQLYNPDFGWEEVNKREAGIELGFWKDRVQLNANYYNNITKNQLIQYPLPTTTGFSGILKNLPATIRNTGLEVEISANLLKKERRNWSVSFNLTIPRNKLVRYDGLASSSYANSYIIGRSLSIVKRFDLNGIDPSTGVYTFIDYNNDGQLGSPQDEQRVIDGSQRYFGGLQQSLTFGRVTVSLLIQFVRQPYASNYLSRFPRPGALGNQPIYVLKRWQKPGDNTDIQRFSVSNATANIAYSYYQASNAGYSDASFVRLRSLYLEYDLLSGVLKKSGLSRFVLFLQGHNLLTLTSYKGLDPETQSFLPPVRLITAGIQINFN
jgi:TonB-linked SusC/RagA family outer membrane protein